MTDSYPGGNTVEGSVRRLVPSRGPLQLIVAALLFMTISRIHQQYTFLAVLRPGELLFGSAVFYAILDPRSVRLENLWTSWPPKVVFLLGVLAAISVPFALSIGSAGSYYLDNYLKVLLIAFLTMVSIRNHQDLYLLVWAYVLACGFLSYSAIFTFELTQESGVYRLGNLTTFDANGLGVILNVGIPLCFVTFRNSKRWWGRVVSAVILIGIGASLARTGSRGGLVGLLAVGGTLFFLLKSLSVAKRIGALAAIATGLVLMSPPGYWQRMTSLTEPTQDYNWDSVYGRRAIAERGFEYMLSHPLTGVGVGNFGRAEWKLSGIASQRQRAGLGFRLTAAHNSFVQVGAELGIAGLVLFCVLVFGGAVAMRRVTRKLSGSWEERGPPEALVVDLARVLPASWAGFAVTATFVSWAYLDLVYILATLTMGVHVVFKYLDQTRNLSRPSYRTNLVRKSRKKKLYRR